MVARSVIDGGNPARKTALPYGCQWVDEEDIQSVIEVLRSDWLTTGPKVADFESKVAEFVDAREAVAVSSGTAALHSAMFAIGIGSGDEVIVPAMTFAATANCVVYQGGTPVFADVDPDTLLITPAHLESKITSNTKAVIAVDYTGQPCDYDALRKVVDRYGLTLVADACHALGGSYKGRKVGSLAELNTFSFHPVKQITTGEGGMITTDHAEFAERMRLFRNHGITTDHRQRAERGSWFYEMMELGYNYRITDFQCVLGMSQMEKLPQWIKRRQEIANQYNNAFKNNEYIKPLSVRTDVSHAYHLYVVRISLSLDRTALFTKLLTDGIGVNVHYIPVYFHPFYQKKYGTRPGLCPNAESAYEEILSLPIFPRMTNDDVERVIEEVIEKGEMTDKSSPNRENRD